MAIPIQRCKYCGTYSATRDGFIPVECTTCYRGNWAIDTTKPNTLKAASRRINKLFVAAITTAKGIKP